MQPPTLAKRGFLLLLIATALVYFYGLGRTPFVGSDEPRYAEVAREMFARGDLVTPTLGGRTWFEKPALGYWAQMAGFKLFGVSEWSARLGASLAGWLTVLLIGWMCGRVKTSAAGSAHEPMSADSTSDGALWLRLACACVAASSLGLIVFSRAVNFDIFLTATVTLSLACFFASETEDDARKRRLLLAGFYAGAGCALLAKGLVGAVLAFGVVLLYQVLRRSVPRAWKSVLWGVPLMLLVAACWYAPVTYAHGRAFIDEFIIKQHFARFVTNKYHHPAPFYFYLLVLPALVLPWTPFLFATLKNLWTKLRHAGALDDDDATMRLRLFALAWVCVPVAFFSISQSKLPGYILPALPGAAMLAGCELYRYARGEGGSWAMRATGCVLLAAAAAALVFAARTGLVTTLCALLICAPLAVGGVWAIFARGVRSRIAAAIVGASLLTTMLVANCAQEGATRRESVRDLLALASARGYASAPVLNLYTIERSSEFYAAGRVVYDDQGEPKMFDGVDPVKEFARERGEPVLVIVPVESAEQLTRFGQGRTELIGDNGIKALVVVH